MASSEGDFNSMLKVYYREFKPSFLHNLPLRFRFLSCCSPERVFPFKHICRWLSHGDTEVLLHREFGFILKLQGEEVFLRNKCFSSHEELKKEVLRLCPIRAEIGPIFTIPVSILVFPFSSSAPLPPSLHLPRVHNFLFPLTFLTSLQPKDKDSYQANYVPKEKELVFDIDMDAYDTVRTCCSKEKVCQKCWIFLSIGIQVLDQRLRGTLFFFTFTLHFLALQDSFPSPSLSPLPLPLHSVSCLNSLLRFRGLWV
jgi:hypothetical protein